MVRLRHERRSVMFIGMLAGAVIVVVFALMSQGMLSALAGFMLIGAVGVGAAVDAVIRRRALRQAKAGR
jgi:hypothetical protein